MENQTESVGEAIVLRSGESGYSFAGINLPVAADDFPALKALVVQHAVDLVVVDPKTRW
jgi:hypothetical protein